MPKTLYSCGLASQCIGFTRANPIGDPMACILNPSQTSQGVECKSNHASIPADAQLVLCEGLPTHTCMNLKHEARGGGRNAQNEHLVACSQGLQNVFARLK